jgi:pre-mRNA-processing factor 6
MGMGLAQDSRPGDDEDGDRGDFGENQYDEFSGYGGNLFGSDVYDQDDQQADLIWDSVDRKMEQRRDKRREEYEKAAQDKAQRSAPKISAQFEDLKRGLASVSESEWASIPDIGDYRVKRIKRDSWTPVPDKLIMEATSKDKVNTVLGGMETPFGSTPVKDLSQIGTARKQVLDVRLASMSDSVSGQTHVDPKGYLTELAGTKLSSDAEIGDFKKARLLLKSVITTNPKHPPGWIALARLEERAGKIVKARKIIARGCQNCGTNEDVWLEAARLNTPQNAKIILASGVKAAPLSVKLWIAAAQLEQELPNKKLVLRKALESIPESVRLWKAAVELEESDVARILLSRAVECVPHSVEMWVALAHLETYDKARVVLNSARKAVPTDHTIWIEAAKLEEANGNADHVRPLIHRGFSTLARHNVVLPREQWLKEAEVCETAGHPVTAAAIVGEAISLGLEDVDKKHTWMDDAETAVNSGSFQTARAIFAHALKVFPKSKGLWIKAAQLEKQHGTQASLDDLLRQAVRECPHAQLLWLMGAKEKWVNGDVPAAREILQLAFQANPDSEVIWLAGAKLERENDEPEKARTLLAKARTQSPTQKIYLKSCQLERRFGHFEEERLLLDQGLQKFPQVAKLWLLKGEVLEYLKDFDGARDAYKRGVTNCSKSLLLWIASARLEHSVGQAPKARAILESARLRVPKSPELWMAQIELEDNNRVALQLLAKGLQECPHSGLLWAAAIALEIGPQKKARSIDALKACDSDPHVLLEVAKQFWSDRKIDKARSWLQRCLVTEPKLGDAWAFYYLFELQNGNEETRVMVVRRCVEASPKLGRHWRAISKALEWRELKTADILAKVVERLPPAL